MHADVNQTGSDRFERDGATDSNRLRVGHVILGVAAAMAGGVLVFLVVRNVIWCVTFPYEFKGWAEGHFLYNALQLSRGQTIYPDPDSQPITVMFYGFLYPFVMAPFVRAFGPELWIGRTVSVAAIAASLACIYAIAARRAGSRWAGVIGVALAFGGYYLSAECWDWGHSDALFIALGLASLTCVDQLDANGNRGRIALAVLLSCASCCAKQTGGGFVLAITISLLLRRWRLAASYAIASIVLMCLVAAVGHVLTGGLFERYMLMDLTVSHPFYWPKIPVLLRLLAANAAIFLIAAIWQIKRDVSTVHWSDAVFWSIVFVGAASMVSFSRLKGGLNSLMPLFFLLAIPAGVRFAAAIATSRQRAWTRTVALAALLGQLALFAIVFYVFGGSERKHATWYHRAGDLIAAELDDPNERVLMLDRISFAVQAGRPVYDGVSLAKIPAVGQRLSAQFAKRHFDKVLIQKTKLGGLPSGTIDVLVRHYRVDHEILPDRPLHDLTPMLVFVPKQSASTRWTGVVGRPQ